MMEKITQAIEFAARAHDGMRRRRDDIPYILHPLEVAAIVSTLTNDQDVISAAVLHDVVEDTEFSAEDVKRLFGERVAYLVASETENKREHLPAKETWKIRKQESLDVLKNCDDEAVKMIWLSDKLANMRSFYRHWTKDGDKIWEALNQKDPQQQAWYYLSIAELTSSLKDSFAWQEYNKLTRIVFGKAD